MNTTDRAFFPRCTVRSGKWTMSAEGKPGYMASIEHDGTNVGSVTVCPDGEWFVWFREGNWYTQGTASPATMEGACTEVDRQLAGWGDPVWWSLLRLLNVCKSVEYEDTGPAGWAVEAQRSVERHVETDILVLKALLPWPAS